MKINCSNVSNEIDIFLRTYITVYKKCLISQVPNCDLYCSNVILNAKATSKNYNSSFHVM